MTVTLTKIKHPRQAFADEIKQIDGVIPLRWHSGSFRFEVETDEGANARIQHAILTNESAPGCWTEVDELAFRLCFDTLDKEMTSRYLFLRTATNKTEHSVYQLKLVSPFLVYTDSAVKSPWIATPNEYYIPHGSQIDEVVSSLSTCTSDEFVLIHGPISCGKSTYLNLIRNKLAECNCADQAVIVIELKPEDLDRRGGQEFAASRTDASGKARTRANTKPEDVADEDGPQQLWAWLEQRILSAIWNYCIPKPGQPAPLLEMPKDMTKEEWMSLSPENLRRNGRSQSRLRNRLKKLTKTNTDSSETSIRLVFLVDELDRLHLNHPNFAEDILLQILRDIFPSIPTEQEGYWCRATALVAADRSDYKARWTFDGLYADYVEDRAKAAHSVQKLSMFDTKQIMQLIEQVFDGVAVIQAAKPQIAAYIKRFLNGNPLLTSTYLHLLLMDWAATTTWQWPESRDRIALKTKEPESLIRRILCYIEGKSHDSGVASDRLTEEEKRVYREILRNDPIYPSPSSGSDEVLKTLMDIGLVSVVDRKRKIYLPCYSVLSRELDCDHPVDRKSTRRD